MKSVYILRNDWGLHKIGITNNIKQRIASISNNSGLSIEIIYLSSKVENAQTIETYLHRKYSDYRTTGEWFENLDVKIVIEELQTLTGNSTSDYFHKEKSVYQSMGVNIFDIFHKNENINEYSILLKAAALSHSMKGFSKNATVWRPSLLTIDFGVSNNPYRAISMAFHQKNQKQKGQRGYKSSTISISFREAEQQKNQEFFKTLDIKPIEQVIAQEKKDNYIEYFLDLKSADIVVNFLAEQFNIKFNKK
jgi:hypothetical protein